MIIKGTEFVCPHVPNGTTGSTFQLKQKTKQNKKTHMLEVNRLNSMSKVEMNMEQGRNKDRHHYIENWFGKVRSQS